jgi:phosphoribosylformylglycinamidine (FGAM) synthase-like enzyme
VLRSAHDISDGGLAVALAECGFAGEEAGLGGMFDIASAALRSDVVLFSESPSRMIVSTRVPAKVEEIARKHGVPCVRLGAVGGERLHIAVDGQVMVDASIATLREAWMSLERVLA